MFTVDRLKDKGEVLCARAVGLQDFLRLFLVTKMIITQTSTCPQRVSSMYTKEKAGSESTFHLLHQFIEEMSVEWYPGLSYRKRVSIPECLDHRKRRDRGPVTYTCVKLPRKACFSMTFCDRLQVFFVASHENSKRMVRLPTF